MNDYFISFVVALALILCAVLITYLIVKMLKLIRKAFKKQDPQVTKENMEYLITQVKKYKGLCEDYKKENAAFVDYVNKTTKKMQAYKANEEVYKKREDEYLCWIRALKKERDRLLKKQNDEDIFT